MGACCSKDKMFTGFVAEDDEEYYDDEWDEEGSRVGNCGERVKLRGSCKMASMYTQQGKKGINQDAMTMWMGFTGEPDMVLCGVFDGHGPSGHCVASHVRDVLPSKISSGLKPSNPTNHNCVHNRRQSDDVSHDDDVSSHDDHSEHSHDGSENSHDHRSELNHDINDPKHSIISSWNASFVKAFEDMDQELCDDPSINAYCSGSTAVVLLRQEEHLLVANLGDSRALLCTRDNKNHLVPVQLTVDLKPNIPSEAERIQSCNGRVFAMEEEPDVYRLWLPEDDSPGLAMARAFGDFCLKDFGLISTPQVSYRRINCKDEFVVLATDGVWDVLSNKEVVRIVASARKRCMAAKLVVRKAVKAWKHKYPCSKVDDCAVICLFLKPQTSVSRSSSLKEGSVNMSKKSMSFKSVASSASHESRMIGGDEWNALEGVTRVNSVVKLPRLASDKHQKIVENDDSDDSFVST